MRGNKNSWTSKAWDLEKKSFDRKIILECAIIKLLRMGGRRGRLRVKNDDNKGAAKCSPFIIAI